MGRFPITKNGCDQTRLNIILLGLGFAYTPVEFEGKKYLKGQSANGTHDLTMIGMPQDVVCRDKCDIKKLTSYVVCHPHTPAAGRLKNPHLLERGLWIISDNWIKTQQTDQSTSEWLQEVTIALPHAVTNQSVSKLTSKL